MVPYWHEVNGLKPRALSRVMTTLRQWLLVVLVAWVAGWQMMDTLLKHGDAQLSAGAAPVVAQMDAIAVRG